MVFQLVKEVRDINRFREILTVLFEEGFDFLIEKTKLKHKVPLTKRVKKRLEEKKQHSVEKRLRLTLERLGPTFIKFGQVLSVRPDLVPKSYIRELEKLQDEVPPTPYSSIEGTIKAELGREIKDLFASFEKKPVASASISQVHRATLKDGDVVAVKIQRPDVRKIMETDVEIMFYVAKLLEKHMPKMKKFRPVQIVDEFWKWTSKEFDFKKEAMNAKRFARDFSRNKAVKIPKVYDNLITSKILVMEFIDGIQLHDITEAKKRNINLRPLIEKGFEIVLEQVFINGFFHADPHPGNILITADKKLAFVDFGIVGHFDENLKSKSIDLFYGTIENDTDLVVNTLIGLSETEVVNKDEFTDEVNDVLESLQESDISKVKVSYALEEVLDKALYYGLKVPMQFVLFGKTVITLEGIALRYDPKFKVVESSRPFVRKLMRRRYNPAYVANSFMKSLFKFKKLSEDLPETASRALKRIEQGSIKVDIEDTDIKTLSQEIDRSGNRVAYSMLVASLLIVGALTINFGPVSIFGLPTVSFLSFIAALALSLILLHSILREKKIIQ
jgi:ubiquinone biosynthesis protein